MSRIVDHQNNPLSDVLAEAIALAGGGCEYRGGGRVQCCRPANHDGPHLYHCAGRYCPGLPWIASNTPHPVQCNIDEGRVEVRW